MPRPDRHREPLVAAAATALRRQGYAGTSVGAVLEAAGATNGSLYHHFPSGKAGLAQAAIEASAARIDGLLRAALAHAPPAAALRLWIDGLENELRRDPRDGCPIGTPAVELAATDDGLREVAAAAFALWTATLTDALDGDETTARVVLSAIEGALLLDRTARGTEHLAALRRTVGRLVDA